MNTTPSNEESMKLIDDQLRDLGIDNDEMRVALKFSIVQKMAQNTEIPASLK